MEEFTEEHSKYLLAKEWMVKVDPTSSTPYLLKYHFIPNESKCLIIMTDTKKVWVEVMNSKVMARRWRHLNPDSTEYSEVSIEENAWRKRVFDLLSDAHTIGGIADLDFEVADSDYSDLCVRMEGESFKWKWETHFLGFQRSSEIISQHLVFPLISVTHLAFSSAKPFSELSDSDLEKSIDRLGRTAKRATDVHVKNTFSKPTIATSIRRMSAIYHAAADLAPVKSIEENPYLRLEEPRKVASSSNKPESSKGAKRAKTPEPVEEPEPVSSPAKKYNLREHVDEREPSPEPARPAPEPSTEAGDDIETETDTDSDDDAPKPQPGSSKQPEPMQVDSPPAPARSLPSQKAADTDSDASPVRPAKKKAKVVSSDDSDDSSDNNSKSNRSGSGAPRGGGFKRGARQPIKRGGRHF